MIDLSTLAPFRANTAKLENRALLDIPGILGRSLDGRASESVGPIRETVLSKY